MPRQYQIAHATLGFFVAISPYFSQIGRNFEYEAATIMGILSFFLVPLLFLLKTTQKTLAKSFLSGISYKKVMLWHFVSIPCLMLLISHFNLLFDICPCSGRGFLFWQAVQWLPGWFLGHGLLFLMVYAYLKKIPRRRVFSWLFVFYVFVVAAAAATLWFYPQKRLTDLAFGFLHGPIYDRYIPLDFGVLQRRLSHGLIGVFLVLCPFFLEKGRRRWPLYLTASIFVVAAAFSFGFLSQKKGHAALQKLLAGKLTSKGLEVRFPSQFLENKEDKKAIEIFFKSAQFHRKEILGKLDSQDGTSVPVVTIYVYENQNQKKLAFGGGATDVTDVVSPSIHTTLRGNKNSPHPTLRHELVHALLSQKAFFGLGFHPNMAFTEGLAVALAPLERSLSLDQAAASLVGTKRLPNLEGLFSPFFWQVSGMRAYAVAGSFLSFLLEKFGLKKVLAIYNGEKIEKVTSFSMEELLKIWRKKLEEIAGKDKYALEAEALYRDPGVFYARCPHSKVILSFKGHHFLDRIRQPLGWQSERDYDKWLKELSPSNRGLEIDHIERQMASLVLAKEGGDLLEGLSPLKARIESLRKWPPLGLEDVELSILLADLTRAIGEKMESDRVLEELKTLVEEKSIGLHRLRQVYARIFIEEVMPEKHAKKWRFYLAGWGKIPELSLPDGPWLSHYLHLRRNGVKSSKYYEKLMKMPLPQNLPQTFYQEWYRFLGQKWMALKDFKKAARAFSLAAAKSPKGGREFFEMEARRMVFLAEAG